MGPSWGAGITTAAPASYAAPTYAAAPVTTATAAPVSYAAPTYAAAPVTTAAPVSTAAARPVSYAAPVTTAAAPVSYATAAPVSYAAAPVSYAAAPVSALPVNYGFNAFGATPMAAANVGGAIVAGADRNLDGIPDALQGLPA